MISLTILTLRVKPSSVVIRCTLYASTLEIQPDVVTIITLNHLTQLVRLLTVSDHNVHKLTPFDAMATILMVGNTIY